MSKVKYVPTVEHIRWLILNLERLPADYPLAPEEVAQILRVSVRELEEWRRPHSGQPLEHKREGLKDGIILYGVEEVRNYLKSQPTFKDNKETRLQARKRHESFSQFMTNGALGDEWDFTIIRKHEKPIDMWENLGKFNNNEIECRSLTLEEYLNMRLKAAIREKVEFEDQAMDIEIPGPYPPLDTKNL